jgi:hypothetical protein
MVYLIVNNADLKSGNKLLKILLISATISGIYGIIQFFTGGVKIGYSYASI